MTKRTLMVSCVVAAVMLSSSSRAHAAGLDDWWDYLDQLSGPGPFNGIPVQTAKISCWEDGVAKVRHAMDNPGLDDPCLYFEYRRLWVDPKAPYAKVTATIVGVGVTYELIKVFEVGASAGLAYFSTTVGNTDYHVKNPILTPRVVLKPLRLIPKWRDNPRMGFLQMHYRPVVRFGKIDGSDFGVPASTFSDGTELLEEGRSWIVFDVFEALRGRR